MERMHIQVERIEIDGVGRTATAHVVARTVPATPDAVVRVTVNLPVEAATTLADLRRRARDEALRFLDVE